MHADEEGKIFLSHGASRPCLAIPDTGETPCDEGMIFQSACIRVHPRLNLFVFIFSASRCLGVSAVKKERGRSNFRLTAFPVKHRVCIIADRFNHGRFLWADR